MFRPRLLTLVKLLLPPMTWDVADSGSVYLTFDDGPTPDVTAWVLKTLAEYDVKATFFCLGKNVEQYPELYNRIVEEGHKIGNHSYSHIKGWGMSSRQYVEDIDFANQFVGSDLFRPPYGRIRRRQAELLSQRYRLVMGGVVSEDYNPELAPERCLRNVTDNVRAGSIVVFHDSIKAYPNMSYALPPAIEAIKAMGLRFATIPFRDEPRRSAVIQPELKEMLRERILDGIPQMQR